MSFDADGLAAIHDVINMALDVADAHRAAAIARHFTEPAAEAMTIAFYRACVAKMFNDAA